MNPSLPLTVNVLRRAVAGAIVCALVVLALLALVYYQSDRWQVPLDNALYTLQEYQYKIAHLVPYPWE
ncbi:hypothetical protein AB0M22_05780 [Nocardia sp. NPDC051756]|uniref:hypothetical protein n=1 Tax=Nocardia sp. NPDC051756 TaxID=3154751 RepID=UPI0034403ACF